jgi:hypothetical protein
MGPPLESLQPILDTEPPDEVGDPVEDFPSDLPSMTVSNASKGLLDLKRVLRPRPATLVLLEAYTSRTVNNAIQKQTQ